MRIADIGISEETDSYVIAELGHNHQGNLETAKQLFRAAKDSGAHAVKLQKRDNKTLFTHEMYNKSYDNENSYGATYGEHREFLEFNREQYQELKHYANEIGITFFATAFDFKSADFLAELEMPAFKVASGDLTNTPLLRYVAQFQKPIIMSSGGGTLEDVRRAYDTIFPINQQICILQCTAGYPPAWEELNLRVISTFRDAFPDAIVGFSSHDSGIAMAVAAHVLGARVIEKHFTLNRAMKGTDHAFSLEPTGLRKMVRDLQRTRVALGDGVKAPYSTEKAPILKMAKKLVAARPISAGHVLVREDINIKSPADGLPPFRLEDLIGRTTLQPFGEDETFQLDKLGTPASPA